MSDEHFEAIRMDEDSAHYWMDLESKYSFIFSLLIKGTIGVSLDSEIHYFGYNQIHIILIYTGQIDRDLEPKIER